MARKLEQITAAVSQATLLPMAGYITDVGSTIVRAAMANGQQGAICAIERTDKNPLLAEIIGVRGDQLILSPFGATTGLSSGALVRPVPDALMISTGTGLLGRVIDPFGTPIDGNGPIAEPLVDHPIRAAAPPAMQRPMITDVMSTGLRGIDGLLTLGHGQRIGIFGPPGTGKSTLLAAIARHSEVDVVVVALVGERGREVREFIDRDLPTEARKHVCIVAATSDRPAVERALCAQSATAVAEAFRDDGKSVLLLVDSLTRTARALREIGLAAGEAPTGRGYPASVYPALPAIIERSGRATTGDITAIFTVLTEGDAQHDPIAEEVRSLTDGHITLSRALAETGHYPAIDILDSLSRTMPAVTNERQQEAANVMRANIARYREIELLLQVGEYSKGTDLEMDRAIALQPKIKGFLCQRSDEKCTFEQAYDQLQRLVL